MVVDDYETRKKRAIEAQQRTRQFVYGMGKHFNERVTRIERRLKIVPPNTTPPLGVQVVPVMLRYFIDKGVERMQYVAIPTGIVLAETNSGREFNLAQNFRRSNFAKKGMVIQVVNRSISPEAFALAKQRSFKYIPKRTRKVYSNMGNDPEDYTDDWQR